MATLKTAKFIKAKKANVKKSCMFRKYKTCVYICTYRCIYIYQCVERVSVYRLRGSNASLVYAKR